MAFEKVRGEKNVTEVVYCEEHKGRNNHKERRSRKIERLVESRSLYFFALWCFERGGRLNAHVKRRS